jgi:hypothetical protein
MKTRIAFSDKINKGKLAALTEQAKRLGAVRSEVWQRFGSIKPKTSVYVIGDEFSNAYSSNPYRNKFWLIN